jgi:hypothetical protein
MMTFSSLASNLASRLSFDFVAIRRSHLLISRLNLTLSWYRSSIFATKLTFDLGNSRNLLGNQLNVELTRTSSTYRLFPILYREF